MTDFGFASKTALERFRRIQPHIEDDVPLAAIARSADVPIGTLRRWLRCYRADGMAGLERRQRNDRGKGRRLEPHFVRLIEGLALETPRRSVAGIHRLVSAAIERAGGTVPSYRTVHAIIKAMDPAMTTLAHQGGKAYADAFDLLHRREADGPNAIWQADHTQLDILVLNELGEPVRPWLTVIIDDYSRAIAAYRLFAGGPSALQTALALRDAIWRKTDPAWSICGIPDVLYTDHGSDFTSHHIERVCADLKIRMIFSAPGRPRGRGRIERFFSTINQRVLSDLPGYIGPGARTSEPSISLPSLDQAIRRFIVEEYHGRPHSGTDAAPAERWSRDGFLPRMPDSLDLLDLLLLTVARPRQVHRDGVRLNGLRYIAPALAAYVGEPVMVRYDPADMAEIRVYHKERFLCRAICPDLATETVALVDIVRARRERRRDLSRAIKERRALVDALVGRPAAEAPIPPTAPDVVSLRSTHGLRKYADD